MNNITYLECNSDLCIDDSVLKRNDSYDLDDCVLVRTTDIFPFNGIVETPVHGNAYAFTSSDIIGEAILDVLRKKYSGDELLKESKKYEVCFEIFRTTIHFCINGLVTSHMYGNFEGRPYAIIEPLKHHIMDKSLCSLNACDTYFNDDMVLSDEAVLVITEDKFNEIKNDLLYVDTLSKFKIFVYRGNNQYEAVRNVLEKLGYDYFRIN